MSHKFLSDNLIKNSGVTFTATTGTINSQFPLSNILEDSTCKVARSTTNTLDITVDLQTLSTIDFFAICGHSIDGLGFTALEISLSATSSFSGITPISIDLNSEHNFGFKAITSQSARYVKLSFTGTGSYVEISNLFIGEAIEVETNGLSQDSFKYSLSDNSVAKANNYGQKFVTERNKIKSISGSFKFLDDTEFNTLQEMFSYHGITTPIWVLLDPDGELLTDSEWIFSGYFYLNKIPEFTSVNGMLWNTAISLDEVV